MIIAIRSIFVHGLGLVLLVRRRNPLWVLFRNLGISQQGLSWVLLSHSILGHIRQHMLSQVGTNFTSFTRSRQGHFWAMRCHWITSHFFLFPLVAPDFIFLEHGQRMGCDNGSIDLIVIHSTLLRRLVSAKFCSLVGNFGVIVNTNGSIRITGNDLQKI